MIFVLLFGPSFVSKKEEMLLVRHLALPCQEFFITGLKPSRFPLRLAVTDMCGLTAMCTSTSYEYE
jgi:hypothetical protein